MELIDRVVTYHQSVPSAYPCPSRRTDPRDPFLHTARKKGVIARFLLKWVAEMDTQLRSKHQALFDESCDRDVAPGLGKCRSRSGKRT